MLVGRLKLLHQFERDRHPLKKPGINNISQNILNLDTNVFLEFFKFQFYVRICHHKTTAMN